MNPTEQRQPDRLALDLLRRKRRRLVKEDLEYSKRWLNGYFFWKTQYERRRDYKWIFDPDDVGVKHFRMKDYDKIAGRYFLVSPDEIFIKLIDRSFPFFDKSDPIHAKIYSGICGQNFGNSFLIENVEQNSSIRKIQIDCNDPITSTLSGVVRMIENHKESKNEKDISFIEHISVFLTRLEIESSVNVSYGPEGDVSRAIGLWMFDHIERFKCSQRKAAGELEDHDLIGRLVSQGSDPDTWRRMFRKTRACVEAGEVMKIQ